MEIRDRRLLNDVSYYTSFYNWGKPCRIVVWNDSFHLQGNSVLVEANSVQHRRNVTHVKKYLEQDNVPQDTSKSSDTRETVTPSSASPELRESVKVPPGMRSGGSGENLLEHKPCYYLAK